MSRLRLSVPSQCAAPGGVMRAPRIDSSYPYGAIRSANTAISSMAITSAAPSAPSGLPRTNRSTARVPRATAGRSARVRSPPLPASSARPWGPWPPSRGPAPSLVADAGVEDGIAGIDGEVDQHDERDDDQIDALDHRIVALVDRVEQEAAHPRQAEDRLDDHGAADDLGNLHAQERH